MHNKLQCRIYTKNKRIFEYKIRKRMECQGLMFHSFLYVKIINYAEFLPYGVACYKKDCKIKKHNYVKNDRNKGQCCKNI